jgi:hypothetical protein
MYGRANTLNRIVIGVPDGMDVDHSRDCSQQVEQKSYLEEEAQHYQLKNYMRSVVSMFDSWQHQG